MRLYNAQSCTPMATGNIRKASSFPPKGFLPAPALKKPVQRRCQPTKKHNEGMKSTTIETVSNIRPMPVTVLKPAVIESRSDRDTQREVRVEKTKLRDEEQGASSCFLSFPSKSKKNSAFRSPLRIAKYSFQSPPPPSGRTQMTTKSDSSLDLVFSSADSPQISKNETSTTAGTSDVGQTQSDSSESFLFDIEVVKSDSGTPAKLVESGSIISKSSSSTLTSNFAAARAGALATKNLFDDFHANHEERGDGSFSPIPWAVRSSTVATSAAVKIQTQRISYTDPLWRRNPKETSIFESAWFDSELASGDGLSEQDSWIDFTNDPFMTHSPARLQRPSLNNPGTERTATTTVPLEEPDFSGFIVNKVSESRTMETYSGRQSNSGTSEVSFPSLTTALNTWSQLDSLDEPESDVQATNSFLAPRTDLKNPSNTLTNGQRTPRLLGSVLQARFQSKRSANCSKNELVGLSERTAVTKSKVQLHRPSDGIGIKQRTGSKPPLQPRIRHSPRPVPKGADDGASQEFTVGTAGLKIVKYVKMLKMGLPAGAVKNAMIRDGVDTSLLFRPDGELPANISKVNEKYRFFRIHWDIHSNFEDGRLWSKLQQEKTWISDTICVDETEFAQLFRQHQLGVSPPRAKVTASSLVRAIDPKRANNGGIALSQIKLSYEHTAQVVDRMDYHALSMDQMRAILPFVPTKEEVLKLRQSLRDATSANWFRCECEKFMVAMLRVQDAEEKLNHMLFMRGFPDVLEGLKNDAELVDKACTEVKASRSFRRVLALLLFLGNRLNRQANGASSADASAVAITLESLVVLNQSKAFDRKTTFLQYAVSLLRKQASTTLDWKQEDMPSLRRAHRVQWKCWQDEVESMVVKLSALRFRCLQASGYGKAGDTVRLANPIWTFVCRAEVKLSMLKEDGEKATQALNSLWAFFGETSKTQPRCDSILGTLILFGHQWDQAVEQVARREREDRRLDNQKGDGSPGILSPASSRSSQSTPYLASSQSFGLDV